jgi:hypothetical protein
VEIWRCSLNSNSERTQQYGANERKHGEHRQHIEPQGKVHVSFSPAVEIRPKSSREACRAEMTNVLHCGNQLARLSNGEISSANILIFRGKIVGTMIFDGA